MLFEIMKIRLCIPSVVCFACIYCFLGVSPSVQAQEQEKIYRFQFRIYPLKVERSTLGVIDKEKKVETKKIEKRTWYYLAGSELKEIEVEENRMSLRQAYRGLPQVGFYLKKPVKNDEGKYPKPNFSVKVPISGEQYIFLATGSKKYPRILPLPMKGDKVKQGEILIYNSSQAQIGLKALEQKKALKPGQQTKLSLKKMKNGQFHLSVFYKTKEGKAKNVISRIYFLHKDRKNIGVISNDGKSFRFDVLPKTSWGEN